MIETKVTLKSTFTQANLLEFLNKDFPEWDFKDLGEVKRFPKSTHYHIKSKNKSETGTLEVTILPYSRVLEAILHLASNRTGNWGESAFSKLERYLS